MGALSAKPTVPTIEDASSLLYGDIYPGEFRMVTTMKSPRARLIKDSIIEVHSLPSKHSQGVG